MAEVIDAIPTRSERDNRHVRPERTERVPDSTRTPPTDEPSARARAQEGNLRVRTATYEGVQEVIDSAGNSVARAAQDGEAASERSRERDRTLAVRSHLDISRDVGDRRAQMLAEEEARAHEAALAERLALVKEGLARLADDARLAAVQDVRLANEAAAAVDRENRRRHTSEAMRGGTFSPTEVSPEVAEVLDDLARRVGAVPAIKGDGTIVVEVGERPLVDRRGVHPLEVNVASDETAEQNGRTGHQNTTDTTDSGGLAHPRESSRGSSLDSRLTVQWPDGRAVVGLDGTVGGLVDTANDMIPQVARVVDNIATVARAEALAAERENGAAATVDATAVGAASPTASPSGFRGTAAPSAADLLGELSASVRQLTSETSVRHDVAASVYAIRQGPPAAFYAAVVARANSEVSVTGPLDVAVTAGQQIVSDLQQLQDATETASRVAENVATTGPFVPLRVASSEPGLLRVNNTAPQVTVASGSTEPVGPVSERLVAGRWPDLDALVEPLSLDLKVVSVARGLLAMSRAGLPGGSDISAGQNVSLAVGVQAADGGEVPGAPVARLVLSPPVTIESIVDGVNDAAAEAGLDVHAGARTASDGLAHLVLESNDGIGWVAAPRGDGTGADILGGFAPVAPRTETFVMSTTPGLPWSAVSDSATVEGPLPGLSFSLSAEAAGRQVTLLASPQVEELVGGVENFVGAVGAVIDSVHDGAAVPARAAGLASGGDSQLGQVTGQGAATAHADTLAPEAALDEASALPADVATTSPSPTAQPEAQVLRQGALAAAAAAAYGVERPPVERREPASATLGAQTGRTGATTVTSTTPGGTTPDAVSEKVIASPVVPSVEEVALGSSAGASPKPSSPLSTEPEVSALTASMAAAISGVPGDGAETSVATSSAASTGGPAVAAVPGVMVYLDDASRRWVAFDREAFTAALREDPAGTRTAVRLAAAEVATNTKETLDGRLGFLAVRLDQEIAASRRTDVKAASPQWDHEEREELLQRRVDVLTALLTNLESEEVWLREQAP